MKQIQIRQALRNVEIDKHVIGSHVEQLPELIIDLILYFTYSYQFKNRDELRSAVKGYPQNIKKYGNSSLWDVSNITDMNGMFVCSKFQGDISNWDVSNVQDMQNMFYESQFQGDISRWNVSNVTNMMFMFMLSQFQGDISKWNVSNVTNMGYMLYKSQFQCDISNWAVKPRVGCL
jgi:surface protein